ncbi:MAG TPA: translocation/assembly module TamB domain-containing protein [Polyangiaceae bacterium]|nr:translocation/assembly module TamB domain-containing protein [Polyangiaceae bacterium]
MHWFGRALGWLVLGVILLLTIALVSINLPPVSRFVSAKVNAALQPTFQGQLLLRKLGHVDLGGVSSAELEVLDPAGRRVLSARGVDVRLFWPVVAYHAAIGSDPLRISIEHAGVRELDVTLIDDGTGTPTLAHAFEPREPKPPDPDAAQTSVEVAEVTLERARIAGSLASLPQVDAELSNLRARLRTDAAGLALTLENLDLDARQLPTVDRVSGKLTGEVTLPAEPAAAPAPAAGGPVARGAGSRDDAIQTEVHALRPAPLERLVQLAFAGQIAGSGAHAQVRLSGEQLLAKLDAAELTPDTLRQMAPALAPQAPVALKAKVEGQLQDLGVEAQVKQARSRLNARGRLKRDGENTHATLRLDAAAVDLAQLLPDVPRTQIELAADASLDSATGGSRGSYRLVSEGSRVAGQGVPRTTLQGELSLPEARPLHTAGTLDIDEPGAATHVDYSASSGPDGLRAKLFSSTRLARAQRLRELVGLEATGRVELRAELDEAAHQVDADLAVELRGLEHPSFRAARFETYLSARGDLEAPELRLRADARQVRAAGRDLTRLWLTGQGTADRAVVHAHAVGSNPDLVDLTATVAPRSDRQIWSPRVRVCTRGEQVWMRAESVGYSGGRLRVERLALEGPGNAELSLRYGHRLERLDLTTQRLDLARLLRIAGVQLPLRSAQADLEAHVSSRAGRPSGRIVGDIRQIAYAELRGSLHTDLGLERNRLNGDARLELAPGGTTAITLRDLEPPLSARDLQRLSGDITAQGELDLAQIQSLLPRAGVERAQGRLRYDVKLLGQRGGQRPSLHAHLESQSLALVGQRADVGTTTDAELARMTAPWSLRGIDVNVDAGLERGVADVHGKLFDEQGDLVTWNASWRGLPEQLGFAIPASVFVRAPFQAQLHMPSRELERLPPTIRPNDIEGDLALSMDAEGTLQDPRVLAHATLARFTPASERKRKAHLDLNIDAEYATAGGRFGVKADHTSNRAQAQTVLELESRWSGDARRLAGATDGKSPIQADLDLDLNEFPLGVVPLLQQNHVRGRVSGKARLKGFGRDASLDVDLRTRELAVERLVMGELHAGVRGRQGQLELTSEINGRAGQASARVNAPLVWGDRVVPSTDGRMEGTLETSQLRLSALLPLLEGSLSELDGKLDSNFKASIGGGESQLTGHASLRDGVIHMPALGQRFSKIEAEVNAGPGEVRIENVKARGVSGGFEAQAVAKLVGLVPASAEASLKIKEDDKLPLTIEGEAMGDIWGNLKATYTNDQANQINRIDVKLDKVHVILPDAPPRGLQELDQPEYIRVGYRRRDGDFTPIALQLLEEPSEPSEMTTKVEVDLGTVSLVKGQQAKVDLTGKIVATLGDELDVQGQISTKRGQLDISGKTFDIERGTVAFTGGKPDDPTINAVARYDSPAGYTVYAEYTGTAAKGKLAMRSEPPLSQDEIVTLLLFGSPDGSIGAGNGDSLSTAVSVAGGSAAQGLNRAISDVTDLDVSARVDTSTGAPRPELVLQLTPRVAAKVTEALGEPVPGQSPDRTFVTLDLRLGSSWSLSTTVGDRGATAFDMIWRRRY